MNYFKKFLIISSYAPPAISGAPLMMYNLLKYFPDNSFCILTSHFGINNRMIDKGSWLKVKYFYFDTTKLTSVPQKEETFFQKAKKFIKKTFFLNSLARVAFLFYFSFNIIKRGKKIIKEENIELLLGYSDYGPVLFSTYLLHKLTKKPYFLYFYDLYFGNNFSFPYKILARFLEPKLFKSSEKIFVMSEALQKHYQRKYKREIIVIHNSIQISKINTGSLNDYQKLCRIIYTGSIYWPQIGAIKNLIKVVEGLKELRIEFYLFTPHSKEFLNKQDIFESKKIIFKSVLPSDSKKIQRLADILFVPLSFNTKYPLLINTSSPGKTYEYLISGKPILIHAPKNSYISEYAINNNFALVVDEENTEKLKGAIIKLFNNRKLVEKFVNNARQTAFLNHDAAKNSEKFKFFLNNE